MNNIVSLTTLTLSVWAEENMKKYSFSWRPWLRYKSPKTKYKKDRTKLFCSYITDHLFPTAKQCRHVRDGMVCNN